MTHTPPTNHHAPVRGPAARAAAAAVAVLLGLVMLVACGPSPTGTEVSANPAGSSGPAAADFPRDVTIDGAIVHLEKKPSAIVVLSPSLTETVYGIGAGAQVAAVDNQSNYPAEVKASDLDAFAPNIEAIVGMSPDLVLLSNDQDGIVAKLKAVNITSVVLAAPTTLEQAYTQFEQVGELTGNDEAAKQLAATTKQRVDAAIAKAKATAAKSYYWELDATQHYSITSETFVGEVLSGFGLTSIADAAPNAAKSGGYPQLSAEFIVDADPDVIFAPGGDVEAIRKRAGWDVTRAVKDADGIVAIDGDVASRWGPRLAELAEQVGSALEKLS